MWKANLIPTVLFLFLSSVVFGQEYRVAAIPDSLKADASVIVSESMTQLQIKSYNSGKEKIVQVLTILSKAGEDPAALTLHYDKNTKVTINDITYFDKDGKKIKSVKQSEISDAPMYGSSQLFSENRIKYFKPSQPVYPYSVKYDYEISIDNSLTFGVWRPYTAYNMSTLKSTYIVNYPAGININIKEVLIHRTASESSGGRKLEKWEITNMKAIETEPFCNSIVERVPAVYVMPAVLIYDKYEGKADNWTDYGRWIKSLYDGRDNISETDKSRINGLIKEIPDTLDKIKAMYSYMQQNTRYVNITLGLGGFQPFDAATVSETGYGDCKALTNYMFSLLELIGVKSYPALVSSGTYKEKIFSDFPNFQQFDHVILCVPLKRDTLWLECTDQKIPFGFLGDFTDDREVLLLTESGGKFAHTQRYGEKENIRTSKSEFVVDSEGSAVCNIRTIHRGLQYDEYSEFLGSNSDEQKKWLYSTSSLPSLQIKSYSVKESRKIIPAIEINQSVVSKNYCSFSGNYMLMPLNVLNAQKSIQKMLKPRLSEVVISRYSVDCDTMVYKIPANYNFESLPKSININSTFGNYSFTFTSSDKEVICIRKFTIFEGRYKSAEYKALYDFVLAISKADNSKIILNKKI